MDKMNETLAVLNSNPCTAFDPAIFPTMNEEELAAAKRAWHCAIYSAAIAMSSLAQKAWLRQAEFNRLRAAASPDTEDDEIWLHIHDREVEEAEAAEGRRILDMEENRA